MNFARRRALGSSLRRWGPAIGACLAVVTHVAVAVAAPITIGSPTAPNSTPSARVSLIGNASTVADLKLGELGANISSPIAGTVIRWRMAGNFAGGPFELRILKPSFEGHYSYGAISLPVFPDGLPQTIGTHLPIEAGDIVALEVPNESAVGYIETPGSEGFRAVAHPPVAEGQAWEGKVVSRPESEFAFNADVLAPPSVTAVAPANGAASGGGSVAISGSDFSEVQKVDFGGIAASSYTVESEGSIVATAPPASLPGTVDVTVTSAAGTSTTGAFDNFTYAAAPVPALLPPPPSPACKVPDLRGRTLRAAKKNIRAADCRVGRIRRGRRGGSKVLWQKPKPGTRSKPGTEISVGVGHVKSSRATATQ